MALMRSLETAIFDRFMFFIDIENEEKRWIAPTRAGDGGAGREGGEGVDLMVPEHPTPKDLGE